MTTSYGHLTADRIEAQIRALQDELESRAMPVHKASEPDTQESTMAIVPDPNRDPNEVCWLSTEGYIANGGFVVPGQQRKAKPTGTGNGLQKAKATLVSAYGEMPKPAPVEKPITRGQVVSAGFYTFGDTVAKVQVAKQSRKPYALVLNVETGKFEYTPGVFTKLRAEDRLTLDRAQAFGRRTGVCGRCGAQLTDPKSIDQGIGPICAGKL